jgi:hypothetical protein
MIKDKNSFLTIIFLLMVVTGFIYYFIYLKSNEGFFFDPTSTRSPTGTQGVGAGVSSGIGGTGIAGSGIGGAGIGGAGIAGSGIGGAGIGGAGIAGAGIAGSGIGGVGAGAGMGAGAGIGGAGMGAGIGGAGMGAGAAGSSGIGIGMGGAAPTIPICKPETLPGDYKSIMSRYFGVGFNIEYISQNNTDSYLINHIPTLSTGILGGCYSITSDNLLTIKLKNSTDSSQLWSITSYTDSISDYFVVTPFKNSEFALQYENGSLSLRPLNISMLISTSSITSIFEGQKWLLTKYIITRGIPVLNYNPHSLFTPEFDPYNSPQSPSKLTDHNSQQINDVITAVRSGIQQYLGQLNNNNQTPQITSSSLGQKNSPLNVNLNLSSKSNQVSSFANVGNTDLSDDILSVMDKYGPTSDDNNSSSKPLYNQTSLQNELSQYKGCKLVNLNDYTSNRVSSCNCKL